MARRLGEALNEISVIDKYDYRVVNDDLQVAVDHVRSIINAEQCRLDDNVAKLIVNQYKEDL